MQLQPDYFAAYHNLKLTRDANGVLVAEFHSNGGPFIMTAQSHTEFVDAFYRIGQDRGNKIVILTGAGGQFITDVAWSSFGDVTDPGVWSQAAFMECVDFTQPRWPLRISRFNFLS